MAVTQSTGQKEIDAETARNAADILSIIADYENEVDTVVGDSTENAGADLNSGKHEQPRAETPVHQTAPTGQPAAPAAAPPEPEPPEPAQALDEQSEAAETPAESSQPSSTQESLDEQMEMLQRQMNRTRELQDAGANALAAEDPPAVSEVQTPEDPIPDLTASQSTPPAQTQPDASFAEELESVKESIAELKGMVKQGLNAGQSAEAVRAAEASAETVATELGAMRNVLSETLAAQTALTQEVQMIKTQMAEQNHVYVQEVQAQQPPSSTVAASAPAYQAVNPNQQDTAEELIQLKARIAELEGLNTSVNHQPGNDMPYANAQGFAAGVTQENLAARQAQELGTLLEVTNADKQALEVNLIEAHRSIQNLQLKSQLQDESISDYMRQVTELHAKFEVQTQAMRTQFKEQTSALRAQVVDQNAALIKAQHQLRQEVAQRKEVEQLLGAMRSRFQSKPRSVANTVTL